MPPWSDWRILSTLGKLRVVAGSLSLLYLPALLVLAFWPAPGKYPVGVPVVASVVTLIALWRNYLCRDDIGAALVVAAGLLVLAAWTMLTWQLSGLLALTLLAFLAGGPLLLIYCGAISSGAADESIWYREEQ